MIWLKLANIYKISLTNKNTIIKNLYELLTYFLILIYSKNSPCLLNTFPYQRSTKKTASFINPRKKKISEFPKDTEPRRVLFLSPIRPWPTFLAQDLRPLIHAPPPPPPIHSFFLPYLPLNLPIHPFEKATHTLLGRFCPSTPIPPPSPPRGTLGTLGSV